MKKALLTLALLVSGSVFAECDMQDVNGCGPIVQPELSTELACTVGVDCVQDEVKTIACDDPSCGAPVKVACSVGVDCVQDADRYVGPLEPVSLGLLVSGSVFAECDILDVNGCGPIVQPEFNTELACIVGVDCVQDEIKTIACDNPSCGAPVKVVCDNPSCQIVADHA